MTGITEKQKEANFFSLRNIDLWMALGAILAVLLMGFAFPGAMVSLTLALSATSTIGPFFLVGFLGALATGLLVGLTLFAIEKIFRSPIKEEAMEMTTKPENTPETKNTTPKQASVSSADKPLLSSSLVQTPEHKRLHPAELPSDHRQVLPTKPSSTNEHNHTTLPLN